MWKFRKVYEIMNKQRVIKRDDEMLKSDLFEREMRWN